MDEGPFTCFVIKGNSYIVGIFCYDMLYTTPKFGLPGL